MNLIGQFVIVPLSVVALLTGIVQSLGTEWGLFRHYWLLMKFLLTLAATFLLLLHQYTAVTRASKLVSAVRAGTMPSAGSTGVQLTGDAGLGLLVLLIITILSFYKPWGLTRYGRRILKHRSGQTRKSRRAAEYSLQSSAYSPLSVLSCRI
jgi:hypothetical protein